MYVFVTVLLLYGLCNVFGVAAAGEVTVNGVVYDTDLRDRGDASTGITILHLDLSYFLSGENFSVWDV